jgi:hypothetical protein
VGPAALVVAVAQELALVVAVARALAAVAGLDSPEPELAWVRAGDRCVDGRWGMQFF